VTEDFLSRWARLKRESTANLANSAPAHTAGSEPTPCDPPPAAAIDVSSLPPVESISAESNVAAFLQAGVPEDLTRAALRNAWASDPSIRDFVGIAENQWDFNGEGAMAGFGSLSAEEYARSVAAHMLAAAHGERREADKGESATVPASNASKASRAEPRTTNAAPPSPVFHDSPVPPQVATAATVPEPNNARQPRRTHGTALPR
jgi:hypothetical protein